MNNEETNKPVRTTRKKPTAPTSKKVKENKDGHVKKVVTGVFIYWILFIIVTYITFWVKGSIPDTLVQVALGGGTFELICTTVIEVAKKIFEKGD